VTSFQEVAMPAKDGVRAHQQVWLAKRIHRQVAEQSGR
jgi:glutamine synthetase